MKVSKEFIECYQYFNVYDMSDKVKSLSEKERYLLLICTIDNHSDEDHIVLNNYNPFQKELKEIIQLHEGEEIDFDFSFIPYEQISYQQIDYRLADGACSGRHLANSLLSEKYKYFLHTDSHSRAKQDWDEMLISEYIKCSVKWGEEYIFTKYPHGFTKEWDENGNSKDIINIENE